MKKTINITSDMVHKPVVITAWCTSLCGQQSIKVTKEYYVGCALSPMSIYKAGVDIINITVTLQQCQSLYYTLDGTTPTRESTEYTQPIVIHATPESQAITVKSIIVCNTDYSTSEVQETVINLSRVLVLGNGTNILGNKTEPYKVIGGNYES